MGKICLSSEGQGKQILYVYIFASYKPDQKEENEQFDYTLTVPFIPGFSENLKRELRKLGVRVAFRKGRTLESILCRLKFREPFEKSKNNIYKRNCKNCNFTYIGETSQYQQCRHRGHKDAIKAYIDLDDGKQYLILSKIIFSYVSTLIGVFIRVLIDTTFNQVPSLINPTEIQNMQIHTHACTCTNRKKWKCQQTS